MLTMCTNRFCSVVVITLVSDAGDLGSIPSKTFLFCVVSNRDILSFLQFVVEAGELPELIYIFIPKLDVVFSLLVGEWHCEVLIRTNMLC